MNSTMNEDRPMNKDRELLRVAMDELYDFTVGEVDWEGPKEVSRRLVRLAERIEKHLAEEHGLHFP